MTLTDNWTPTMVLESKPMGYLFSDDQADQAGKHFNWFNIETESLDHGVFVTMNQPMMTVIPLLFDDRAKYTEVATLPLYSLTDPGTASNLKEQVNHFNDENAFSNEEDFRKLTMHITAVEEFENSEQADKVVKHMDNFKLFLDQQNNTSVISDEAYHNLINYADFLIEKWK